jgi:zinc transporter 2
LTGVLVYLAILRIIKKEYEIQGDAMIITASLGVVFNIVMYFILHTNKCFNGIELSHHGHSHSGDGHGHGHGHSHAHGHSHNSENHNHSHGNHNHGHSHSKKYINRTENNMPINDSFEVDNRNCYEPEESDKNDDTSNINIRAAAIHVIGDFIQSLGVLIAAIIIRIKVLNICYFK